jgi:uncharacterized sulfatase
MRSLVGLPPEVRAYPELLREAGYYCVNNAKTDYNVDFQGKIWDESSKKAHWRGRATGQPFMAVFNHEITHESKIRSRPHTLVHDPAKAPVPPYHPDRPEVRHDWAQYYDNITTMDGQVAERLKELAEDGLADDTIVFFYGDNGSGMPRHKRWPLYTGLQVPLIIYVPEKWRHLAPRDYAPNGVSQRLVSFVDFAPTLCSLAGIKPPAYMQGKAFMGPFATRDPRYMFGLRGRMDERMDLVRSVTDGRFIYVRNFLPHLIYGQHLAYMFETPTTRVWKEMYDRGELKPPATFFWEQKPTEELYDVTADPYEVRNLAEDRGSAKKLRELREALREHLLAIQDLGFIPEAERARLALDGVPARLKGDDRLYPMKRVLEAAEAASSRETDSKELGRLLQDANPTVRYWGVIGLQVRGESAVKAHERQLQVLLADPVPSVAVAAGQALAVYGDARERQNALEVFKRYAAPRENGVYLSLAALAGIEAGGYRDAQTLEWLKSLDRRDPKATDRVSSLVPRAIEDLVGK